MIKHLLRAKDGNMYPLVAAVLFVVMIFLAVTIEIWRVHAVSTGVYNAVRAGTETAVTKNAAMLYSSQTDMAANTYDYSDNDSWEDQTDTGAITGILQNNLGLRQSGNDWIKCDDAGHELYRLAGLNIQVSNPYAPSGSVSNAAHFTITVTFTLKTTFQVSAVPIATPMEVNVSAGGKF
ncbi:MAG: hypothetical protein ABF904_09185 [Ethanoligenens sp.]